MKVPMSVPRLKSWLLLASLLVTISAARPGHAQIPTSLGDIKVCYLCEQSFGFGSFIDGPTFLIHNTSGSSITNGVLQIGPGGAPTDFFNVGTILAGGTVAVVPGISNDQRSGHTFFAFICSECALDTSGSGPNGDGTQFEFTGRQGSKVVDSGVFTPAATRQNGMNFLGGPNNNDEEVSCGSPYSENVDCFNRTVATLSLPSTFSVTITQPLLPGPTTFDYGAASGGPTLKGTVDYTGTTIPSGITIQGTIRWITDKGWLNDFDFLTVRTQFFGKKCLHQQIKVGGNLVFACVETLYQCSTGGTFSQANCPLAATGQFIKLTLEFVNETDDPTTIKAPFGLIQGADDAQTCTTGGRPACENLENIPVDLSHGTIVANGKGKPPHLCILVPYSTP